MNSLWSFAALVVVLWSHPLKLSAQSTNGNSPSNTATSAPAPTGWARVQALSPGEHVHITTGQGTLWCSFESADAQSIRCRHGKQTETRTQAEVRRISVSHRGRSMLIGAAIGAGGGAVAGAAVARNGQIIGRGGLAAILGIPLGSLGGAVGAATDFTHQVVYRAP